MLPNGVKSPYPFIIGSETIIYSRPEIYEIYLLS